MPVNQLLLAPRTLPLPSAQPSAASAARPSGPGGSTAVRTFSTTPHAGSPLPSTSTLSLFRSAMSAGAVQRGRDREAGMPLGRGADEYGRLVGWMMQQLIRASQSQRPAEALQGVVSATGEAGQQYLAGKFGTELLGKLLPETAALEKTLPGAKELGLGGTSAAGKFLGAAGAAYSLYQLAANIGHNNPVVAASQGVAAGAYIGSVVPGVGTLVGGAAGGGIGALLGLVTNGKHPDQIARDRMRGFLQQTGLIDAGYSLRLADGSRYDIGLDGGARLANMDGSERRVYDTDLSNPLTAQIIAWADPLAAALCCGDPKLKTDLAGYLTNAAISNASNLDEARENVLGFYDAIGAGPEATLDANMKLAEAGRLTEDEAAAYAHSLRTLFYPESMLGIE